MKNFILFFLVSFQFISYGQTTFQKTGEQFENKEYVWEVRYNSQRVGEFWPVHGLNLVTRQTDSIAFEGDIITLQRRLGGIATAPDGMTAGSLGTYRMQGKSLSHGRSCGDGFLYNYGIVVVSPNGYNLLFTHKMEHNFDSLYSAVKNTNGSLFFLPSIFRNGNYLPSSKMIDKVLIRRETFDGDQIGVLLFDLPVICDRAREIILGLDRPRSRTTHIYVLDGGPSWGQSCKEVNGVAKTVGTRNDLVVTNYLVFY